ncbi:hypothetical protein Tco_0565238 [Tanacetum coccineum]
MDITKAEHIALDDALVAPANRLKIGKCNLRLSSDLTSKEATLQVVYDVLKLTPFCKAFQASDDVPEIYMQEFWATTSVHNCSIRFKMNNKKHIVNLDLGHSGEIRKILSQCPPSYINPLEIIAAVINKSLSGEVPPKTKASVHKKKVDSDTTPKEKPPTDPKDKRVKQTIATKRSRIQTLNSQASGSGDGVDILSKVPDEQVHGRQDTDEGAEDQDDEEEHEKMRNEEEISDQLVRTPSDYQTSDESEKQKDDDRVKRMVKRTKNKM